MASEKHPVINTKQYKAAILDLDGVITQTAKVHAKAWKEMFDAFLSRQEGDYQPLDIATDYMEYIDGKPRYDGVRSFLESRGIELPEGSPDDPPEKVTVCGLGNRKNELFREVIKRDGAEMYKDTVDWLKQWKSHGLKTAVISSSKNCKFILEEAGLLHLFDVRVDGLVSEELNIDGKPAPDIFLKAAEFLSVSPENAVIFEDAIAGVQAGKAGGFGLVVGVARNKDGENLLDDGADVLISSFNDLDTRFTDGIELVSPDTLTSALDESTSLYQNLESQTPVFFLDYDGTLSPIVNDPAKAVLSDEMREVLLQLAALCTVSVVSGRDRRDVQDFVQLDELYFAGSHGFDIIGPGGLDMQHEAGREALPELEEAEKELQSDLADIQGAQVERKKYAIAVHYRNVDDNNVADVKQIAGKILDRHPSLKEGGGKKIVELKPDIDWDKGKALLWLLHELDLECSDYFPIYIGDDLTDEDAFKVLQEKGAGILVGEHGQETAAKYHLQSVDEVYQFLSRVKQNLKEKNA